ncbi:MAG: ferritin family protein [Deltaproteobacteria bacterium]|nr:ferritin family protein [Deltaproteobacteria bacterium]
MDRMASIALALRNEQAEMEFYAENAKRSKNPLAKGIFETLAKDEEEHMRRIRGLHEKLLGQGDWPKDVPIEVAGTNVNEVIERLAKLPAAQDHDGDDVAALERGREFEGRGTKFYAELAQACTNPMERKFFEFLSRIEREHLRSIERSLDFFKDPSGWNMERERSGLDGV